MPIGNLLLSKSSCLRVYLAYASVYNALATNSVRVLSAFGRDPRRLCMPISLIALALGGFGIGLTEFVIMGLLPEVAADFGVTPSVAGWLSSGYALSVVVGALGLTAAVTRMERKKVLMALMVL